MFSNLQDLRKKVMDTVGLVSGTGVQTYSEPLIDSAINAVFDMVYRKRSWEWLTDWYTYQLSGADGLVTVDVSDDFNSFEDIIEVWDANAERRIVPPAGREHLVVTGSTAQFYTPIPWGKANAATRILRFYPLTATGAVTVRAKSRPPTFLADSDIIPFPADVIAHAAAWYVLDSDGINPTAASKAQTMFDIGYQDLVSNLSVDVIGQGGAYNNVPLSIRTLG